MSDAPVQHKHPNSLANLALGRRGRPKLTPEQVERLKKRRAEGVEWEELGRMYGITGRTAIRYVTGK